MKLAGPVNVHQAKTQLSRLLRRVSRGEEIILAKAGKPIAKLVPYREPTRGKRVFGQLAGRIRIAPDFDKTPADLIRDLEDGPLGPPP